MHIGVHLGFAFVNAHSAIITLFVLLLLLLIKHSFLLL